MVLNSNGKKLENGSSLRTCALRPAAIYGVEERRHLPRILRYLRTGLVCFNIGKRETLVDWVSVDNLAHAHVLAAEKLLVNKHKMTVSGQVKKLDLLFFQIPFHFYPTGLFYLRWRTNEPVRISTPFL